jgi:nitroimidazol reductase NimA-like FMN-containing flavoprotein (pyridoxamine 5'-phosphate oxidase superfamily)
MEGSAKPQFRTLDRREAEAVLARNHMGRISYAGDGGIRVLLVDYVYSDGWIYGRMPRSRKREMVGWYRWRPVAY